LSKYEKRDLYGRRDYLLTEIARERSTENGKIHWMGLYELKSALLETEAAIACNMRSFSNLLTGRYRRDIEPEKGS
jgi:hypothetical protein